MPATEPRQNGSEFKHLFQPIGQSEFEPRRFRPSNDAPRYLNLVVGAIDTTGWDSMPSDGNLIIDDVEQAMSRMSALGREISAQAVAPVRMAVLSFAQRRGWLVLPYAPYATWATKILAENQRSWVLLDPLLPVDTANGRVTSIRVTRGYNPRPDFLAGHITPANAIDLLPTTGDVGIVDDAAASGRTLRHVAGLIEQAGGRLSRVVVCASSREAHTTMSRTTMPVEWSEYYPGDWTIIHLRDGCAHLPFSGRPAGEPRISGRAGAGVEVRFPPTVAAGSPWQVLALDSSIKEAMRFARWTVATQLGESVGHSARVGDLATLGPDVPALIDTSMSVGADSELLSLMS